MEKKSKEQGIQAGQAKYCEGCGKNIHLKAKVCPHCGYTTKAEKIATNKNLAIVGLVLNIILLPGLGTIVGGDTGKGIAQIILLILSIPLWFVLVGIPLTIAVYIWAIVSSIDQIKRSE